MANCNYQLPAANAPCEMKSNFSEWFKFHKKDLNKKQIAFLNLLIKNGFELDVISHTKSIKVNYFTFGKMNTVEISYRGDGFDSTTKLYY